MTNAILAVFGLGGGELLILVAILIIAGFLLIGALTAVVFCVMRMLSRKPEAPPQPPGSSDSK